MNLSVKKVESAKDINEFIEVPFGLHKNDQNWVPPLRIAVKDILDPKKNPFFTHAEMKMWIVYRDGKLAGRIAGVVDQTHNNFHSEKTAFWGFFESENNVEVAKKLFDTVQAWSLEKGMTMLRGPMNPSSNHECGMQISAFDTKPYVMMTQNPEYYPQLVEKLGFAKAKDLFAWMIDGRTTNFDERLLRRAEALEKSGDIKFRTVNMKDYDKEVEILLDIYNDAWEKNWGFVPMSPDEFRHMAKDMKQIIIPELLFILEYKGAPVGFGLWVPDVNQVFEKIPDGKLFPTGLIKLLWHMKVKKTMNRGRVVTLGIKKKFQPMGLAPLLYKKFLDKAPKLGYPIAECSWILEDNIPMNKGLQYMNATHYKTYRIYDKSLLA